jgi:hypothetical protein
VHFYPSGDRLCCKSSVKGEEGFAVLFSSGAAGNAAYTELLDLCAREAGLSFPALLRRAFNEDGLQRLKKAQKNGAPVYALLDRQGLAALVSGYIRGGAPLSKLTIIKHRGSNE